MKTLFQCSIMAILIFVGVEFLKPDPELPYLLTIKLAIWVIASWCISYVIAEKTI